MFLKKVIKLESIANIYFQLKLINFPGEAGLAWIMLYKHASSVMYTEFDGAALPAVIKKIKSPSHR